jgi:hypothetical protein
MKKAVFFAIFTGVWMQLQGQGLEHHAIFSLQLRPGTTGGWRVEQPQYLSAFNRGGYNNQPRFFSKNEIYLSAQLFGDTTQTDIVSLDLARKVFTQVTATSATAEYSPTLMPNGQRFSAVRVEEDGVQHLWSFPLDRSDNGRREIGRIAGVGYHCWLRDTLVALFIVGENDQPHSLQVAGLSAQKTKQIGLNIGRCMAKTNEGHLAYVHKVSPENWYLKTWDPVQNTYAVLEKMPLGTEDFCLMGGDTWLCGQESKLLMHKAGQAGWQEIADLSRFGISRITRLDVNGDGLLVLVVK